MTILAIIFILIAIAIMASRVFSVILTLISVRKGTEDNPPKMIDMPGMKINLTIRSAIGCGAAGFIIYSALAYFLSLHPTIAIMISIVCSTIPFVFLLGIIYVKILQDLMMRNIKMKISQDIFPLYIGLDLLVLSSLVVITSFIIIFIVYLSH